MVDVYLQLNCESHDPPASFKFLSIPISDVNRLSRRPLPWLRYVMFSICGNEGNLFPTSDASDPVDDDTSLDDLPDAIYYKTSFPIRDCVFVDYQGLNDRITSASTAPTTRGASSGAGVLRRDGSCVITGHSAEEECNEAHLIPRSKGDEYIAKVVQIRSRLQVYDPPPTISGIDDAQNGILLSSSLHRRLGHGAVAFITTPNYRLEPTDIHRVNLGPECRHPITLQQLKKLDEEPFRPRTVDPSNPAPLPPPALILDYIYGVAAYRCWRSKEDSDQVHSIMVNYFGTNYKDIPPFPRQKDDNGEDTSQLPEPDNSQDPTYVPPRSIRRGDAMATAMDDLNSFLMLLHGITPQEAAIRREKQVEEELMAQKATRSKVMEWMKTTAVGDL
ncbi:hypothetical protein OG21DRAFT_1411748 [Imleria badia]|nr:hypothetical protein OG21DRAFT_1411748 [Imleria badia]